MISGQDQSTLKLLIDIYDYGIAYQFASRIADCPPALMDLLIMLRERRELNIAPVYQLEKELGYPSPQNKRAEEEQLANYILDLEAKIRRGQVIDFIRAVSPILYRLFMRVIKRCIPDIDTYIHDKKDGSYDLWLVDRLKTSQYQVLKDFQTASQVTSDSLAKLIKLLPIRQDIKKDVQILRQMERSVRNPLAHLIKPFDEEKLQKTTTFSSVMFLQIIIKLAKYTGISYDSRIFYFDKINQDYLYPLIQE